MNPVLRAQEERLAQQKAQLRAQERQIRETVREIQTWVITIRQLLREDGQRDH